MNLSKYICDLLFENDKVIIPGLGALISKEISAKIHPIEHSFSPPSKEILFNSNLQKNDDLLIDYISKAENISKTKATKHISDFAENCKSELEKGKLIPFTGIGELQIDTHGEITLIPNKTKNFNLDSFGLSNFISPAIQRRDIQKEPEKDLTEKFSTSELRAMFYSPKVDSCVFESRQHFGGQMGCGVSDVFTREVYEEIKNVASISDCDELREKYSNSPTLK